jgi:hypothetical protein
VSELRQSDDRVDFIDLHHRVAATGWWLVRMGGRRHAWKWALHPPSPDAGPGRFGLTTFEVLDWLREEEST